MLKARCRQQLPAVENPGPASGVGPQHGDIKGELGVKDLNLDATIDAPNLDNALPGWAARRKGW
jgi:translocation and assembly module TamB